MKQGFPPDSISTDLHVDSMNAGMKDMLNVISKFLNMGMPLDEAIARATIHPAREIHHEELGHLSIGSPADIAVLRLVAGDFGFVDSARRRMRGTRKLIGRAKGLTTCSTVSRITLGRFAGIQSLAPTMTPRFRFADLIVFV